MQEFWMVVARGGCDDVPVACLTDRAAAFRLAKHLARDAAAFREQVGAACQVLGIDVSIVGALNVWTFRAGRLTEYEFVEIDPDIIDDVSEHCL